MPRNLNVSTVVTVLSMMVSGGRAGGVSSEVHDHLHSFECVKLQVVKTAPDSQVFNLLSVSRLITVLNEADKCGLQVSSANFRSLTERYLDVQSLV